MSIFLRTVAASVLIHGTLFAQDQTTVTVTRPPDAIFAKLSEEDRRTAQAFYCKYLDVGGLSIVAGDAVADEALLRTGELVSHLLAGRPDILARMQQKGTRLIIIGKDQVYTDMPDYRRTRDAAYMNERVRGTGGLDITSFGEENLLNLPIDRYDDESIAVHEFCHTIDAALEEIDSTWEERRNATFRNAMEKGRWKLAYASSNAGEYWAEIAQSYFDCNRINNWNHQNVGTREQLKAYDPEGYELVRDTFQLKADNDWRYTPVRRQPSVVSPPAQFAIDPYFTKFTFARELPIIASATVSDEALLRANDTVRRMFAYRHDILKALINDGARLVVLGKDESPSELPQLKTTATTRLAWDNARLFDYSPELKLMVVPEENILCVRGDTLSGANATVRILARAMYLLTFARPVDPGWDKRSPQIVQQYEKRVERLDERFGQQVQALFEAAAKEGRWRATPASVDPISYWSAGVEAYFDAAGTPEPPLGADSAVANRLTLKSYDPGLYELVERTFAYRGHIDWRAGSE